MRKKIHSKYLSNKSEIKFKQLLKLYRPENVISYDLCFFCLVLKVSPIMQERGGCKEFFNPNSLLGRYFAGKFPVCLSAYTKNFTRKNAASIYMPILSFLCFPLSRLMRM